MMEGLHDITHRGSHIVVVHVLVDIQCLDLIVPLIVLDIELQSAISLAQPFFESVELALNVVRMEACRSITKPFGVIDGRSRIEAKLLHSRHCCKPFVEDEECALLDELAQSAPDTAKPTRLAIWCCKGSR